MALLLSIIARIGSQYFNLLLGSKVTAYAKYSVKTCHKFNHVQKVHSDKV